MAADTLDFSLAATAGGAPSKTFHLSLHKLDATAAPGVGNDDSQGYVAGSVWVDRTNHNAYVCTNNATGAATWNQVAFSGAGAGGDLAGTFPNPTVIGTAGKFAEKGVISITVSASQNNWSPAGLSTCSVIRLTNTLGVQITGLDASAAVDGTEVTIVNVGSNGIALLHGSASSSAANRFSLPRGKSFLLNADESVKLRYSTTTSLWEAVGTGVCDFVDETTIVLTNITTNDVTTSQHGFCPKAPNDTTKFLRGDATWAVPVNSRPQSQTVLSSGTAATYTTPNGGSAVLRVRLWGPGGGGGGGNGGTSQSSAAGGGGAGGYLEKWIFSPSATYTYTVTAGGTGGFNTSAGSASTATTFTDGTLTLTGNSGSGGSPMTSGTGVSYVNGGDGGTATGGDINVTGQPGESGARLSGSVMRSGQGGQAEMGTSGKSQASTNAAGAAGAGYGAGGTGAASTVTNWGGANGLGGLIVIDEYY